MTAALVPPASDCRAAAMAASRVIPPDGSGVGSMHPRLDPGTAAHDGCACSSDGRGDETVLPHPARTRAARRAQQRFIPGVFRRNRPETSAEVHDKWFSQRAGMSRAGALSSVPCPAIDEEGGKDH
jgi:hypothetical protein